METLKLKFRPNPKKDGLCSITKDGKYVFMHKKHKIKPFKTYKCVPFRVYPKYMIVELAPSLFRQIINFIKIKKNA